MPVPREPMIVIEDHWSLHFPWTKEIPYKSLETQESGHYTGQAEDGGVGLGFYLVEEETMDELFLI